MKFQERDNGIAVARIRSGDCMLRMILCQ